MNLRSMTESQKFNSRCDPKEFWSHVDKTGECWVWTKCRNSWGYGEYRSVQTHRYAWFLSNGEIPKGKVICHRCDNPPCVRPDHLFCGTMSENSKDMVRKNRHNTDIRAVAKKYWKKLVANLPRAEELNKFINAPCGHSSQYCHSEDGGKTIRCYVCQLVEKEKELEQYKAVIEAPTAHILRTWDKERIQKFAKHLLGDEAQLPSPASMGNFCKCGEQVLNGFVCENCGFKPFPATLGVSEEDIRLAVFEARQKMWTAKNRECSSGELAEAIAALLKKVGG